jgi:hypothetical protein
MVADQHPIESVFLMSAEEIELELRIDHVLGERGAGAVNFGEVVGSDHSDELNQGDLTYRRADL